MVVGAGMFAVGADLAYDIYDYLNVKQDVDYYEDRVISSADGALVLGNKTFSVLGGYVVMAAQKGVLYGSPYYYVNFQTKAGTLVPFYTQNYTLGGYAYLSDTQYNGAHWSLTIQPYSSDSVLVELTAAGTWYLMQPQIDYAAAYANYTKAYARVKISDLGWSAGATDYTAYVKSYSDPYVVDKSAKTAPQTIPMPASETDLWPGETEAVEIIFPDPDFFPDTTATIIANPQIVTNPIPETQPDPQPSSAPTPSVAPSVEPTGQPNPSAEPTLSPSSTPTPSVVPSSQPTTPPVIGGEDPNPTTPPDDEYDEDDEDEYNGPVIDSPLTPEEALAKDWEDVTPPLIKEYKDPKTGTVVKFNTKTWEITYTKYFEVDIVDTGGKKLGEIDEIDMENKIFYEDKSAKGLYIIPPGKDKPNQTPQEWADYQIRDKTAVRINSALKDGVATMPTPEGSKIVPDIESFRNFREFIFRMIADTVELREATENALNDLRQAFPDYKFSATFGGGD